MNDDERDARIETLTDAIAETNRGVNELRELVGVVSTHVDTLARLMQAHLIHDHGYPEIDDDDDA